MLAWNDLGMHCYNRDFKDLAVLPPYNNLWAQVIKVGDPPQIVTGSVGVSYSFPDNTYSVGKSNFWDYDLALFGVDLPPNIGLTGKGLAGQMDKKTDHFTAEGIPLTEFSDSAPTVPYPYQLATVIARDLGAGSELARTITVAPVSTEMHCDYCHSDGQREGIATGKVETNILTLHDRENADEYPAGVRQADGPPARPVRYLPRIQCLGRSRQAGHTQSLQGHARQTRRGWTAAVTIWQQQERPQQPRTSATTAIRDLLPSACAM